MWPTWYTVQVWNGPDDLFMKSSYADKDTAVVVAQNLSKYYEGRMDNVTLKRWVYTPTKLELEGHHD